MQKAKTNSLFMAICALSLYLLHTVSSGANPAMAALTEHYSSYPVSTVAWTVTIVLIASIPTELFSGTILNKLGFRPTVLIGIIMVLVGGLLPFFVELGLYTLIACRAVIGLAYGMLMPIGYAYVTAFYEGDRRSAMLGIGQSVSGLSGMLVTSLGGILTAISLRYMYLYHLVFIIPLIFLFFMPSPKIEAPTKKKKIDFSLSGNAWFLCIMYGVAMLLYFAWPLFVSNIVVGEGLGTAADAGYVSTVGSLGAFTGGLVYVFCKKVFKNRTYGVSFIGMAIGFLISALGDSILLLYVGFFCSGLFYFVQVSNCMDNLGLCTTSTQYATAVGFSFVLASAATQIGAYMHSFIGGLFGRVDDFRFYYLVSMLALFVIGILFVIRPMKHNAAAPEET